MDLSFPATTPKGFLLLTMVEDDSLILIEDFQLRRTTVWKGYLPYFQNLILSAQVVAGSVLFIILPFGSNKTEKHLE